MAVASLTTRAPGLDTALDALRDLLGDRLTVAAERAAHGRDESWHTGADPDAVAYATSTEEVAAIVRTCAAQRVPVIPFDARTSLEGHAPGNVQGTVEYARDNATGRAQATLYDAFGNRTFIIDSERGVINPNDG